MLGYGWEKVHFYTTDEVDSNGNDYTIILFDRAII
jgi:hypothetical protein